MPLDDAPQSTSGASADLDDLLGEFAVNDCFAYYERLREISPVYWNTRWNGWVVTGYNEVVEGYRDAARLSSDRFSGPFGADVRGAGEHPQLLSFLSKFFVWKDAPYHSFVRQLVNKAFTPRSVEVLRPRIQALTLELADQLEDKSRVDFLGDFAFHLPVIVIAEYLGIPPEARYQIKDWSDDLAAVVFVRGENEDRMARAEQAMTKVAEFLRPIVAERRRAPREDLISALIAVEEDGQRLSEEEVMANIILMIFAGHETTMNLLANAIVAFAAFPDQWQRLHADPGLGRSATEEVLRFDGPIRGLGRWARESFELGGQQIKAGDRVLLVQHAANRDPAGFENPHSLDIGRWPNRHAAFGRGVHTCVGAPLARLEVQEALAYLCHRYERIEPLNDRLEYAPTIASRSLKSLQVRMHPR